MICVVVPNLFLCGSYPKYLLLGFKILSIGNTWPQLYNKYKGENLLDSLTLNPIAVINDLDKFPKYQGYHLPSLTWQQGNHSTLELP